MAFAAACTATAAAVALALTASCLTATTFVDRSVTVGALGPPSLMSATNWKNLYQGTDIYPFLSTSGTRCGGSQDLRLVKASELILPDAA